MDKQLQDDALAERRAEVAAIREKFDPAFAALIREHGVDKFLGVDADQLAFAGSMMLGVLAIRIADANRQRAVVVDIPAETPQEERS